jgi:hypothetical protein
MMPQSWALGSLSFVQEAEPEQQELGLHRSASVADEVAAINAELCGQLEGLIDDSPEKDPRWGFLACQWCMPAVQCCRGNDMGGVEGDASLMLRCHCWHRYSIVA